MWCRGNSPNVCLFVCSYNDGCGGHASCWLTGAYLIGRWKQMKAELSPLSANRPWSSCTLRPIDRGLAEIGASAHSMPELFKMLIPHFISSVCLFLAGKLESLSGICLCLRIVVNWPSAAAVASIT